MKKTPLAIASVIVIGVLMMFAFSGGRRGELSQDVKIAAPVVSLGPDAVSVPEAVDDAQGAMLIAPMDMQAVILIDEIPLILGADGLASQAQAVVQPAVDVSLSGILTAREAAPPGRTGEQTDAIRSAQDALADMLAALEHLSQQAAATRESVALLVSQ